MIPVLIFQRFVLPLTGLALFSYSVHCPGDEAAQLKFIQPAVAYHPRQFSPFPGSSAVGRDSITLDLRLLRRSGFRSLVTYDSSGALGSIPELARQEGFDGTVIMGIWDPFSEEERQNAISQSRFVDGYCLGNEGLGVRYDSGELAIAMIVLRRESGRPVTTSEPIESYLVGTHRDWLIKNSDWLFPIAHPFWAGESEPIEAVRWVLGRYDFLVANTGKRVILKEIGVPTGLSGYSEAEQVEFFGGIDTSGIRFFYFEAFDQLWKPNVLEREQAEAYWGLYRSDGSPKRVIEWLKSRETTR